MAPPDEKSHGGRWSTARNVGACPSGGQDIARISQSTRWLRYGDVMPFDRPTVCNSPRLCTDASAQACAEPPEQQCSHAVRRLPVCFPFSFLLACALAVGCSTGPSADAPQLSAPGSTTTPSAASCLQTATLPSPARALRMAAAAQQELVLWGSPSIDAQGRLTQSGAYEAEDLPRSALDGLAPWQRVLGYWRAVDPESARLPYIVRYGAWRPAYRDRLQAELARVGSARVQGPFIDMPEAAALSPSTIEALGIAVDRVAVIDTPWSAAFISWLAREAGLVEGEFTFSEAHADYARAGYATRARELAGVSGDRNALRACALASTPPRVGDLVCHARGRASQLDSFESLGAELTDADAGVPMHCDIVVMVDHAGLDAIGGNLLQAVTQRRLAFASGTRILDASYQPGACERLGASCQERHMSQQPWSLLLQWR